MRLIDRRIKYWEMVIRCTNKTVKKNKAKRQLEYWKQAKEFNNLILTSYFDEYLKDSIDRFDDATKGTLNK